MITVESTANPNQNIKPRPSFKKVCCLIFILLIAAVVGIFVVGSPKIHQ